MHVRGGSHHCGSSHVIVLILLTSVLGGGPLSAQPRELDEKMHDKITRLSKEGDRFAEQKQYRKAAETYVKALQLLPEPIEQWEACTWLLTAIGDVHFLSSNYEYSKRALSDAMLCPGGVGNPFIHLRLGESCFELGDKERAADELARAFMGAGKDIFGNEDPKYFRFLKTVLKPPADGKW